MKSLAVFFDIGDTLAVPSPTAQGVLKLTALPFIPEVLKSIRKKWGQAGGGIRLGLMSNTGNETRDTMLKLLTDAGLLSFFDPALLLFSSVEGMDKTQKAFFSLGADCAGLPASQCVFVGE